MATLQTRYSSEAECSAATAPALMSNNNFDYPTLLARCRTETPAKAADVRPGDPVRAAARRG